MYVKITVKIATALLLLKATVWAAPATAMTYSYNIDKANHTLVIHASGVIEPSEYSRFYRFFWKQVFQSVTDESVIVVFDSPGGDVDGAMALAFLIQNSGWATGVAADGECVSACTVVLSAGALMSVAPTSKIGVHRSSVYVGNINDDVKDASPKAEQFSYDSSVAIAVVLRERGAPPAVVEAVFKTPSDTVYWLTQKDLADWHVNTICPHC